MKLTDETMQAALRCGAKLKMDAVTGICNLTFDRDDFTRDEWRTLLRELLGEDMEEDDD